MRSEEIVAILLLTGTALISFALGFIIGKIWHL